MSDLPLHLEFNRVARSSLVVPAVHSKALALISVTIGCTFSFSFSQCGFPLRCNVSDLFGRREGVTLESRHGQLWPVSGKLYADRARSLAQIRRSEN
jgi:hypothetical protein